MPTAAEDRRGRFRQYGYLQASGVFSPAEMEGLLSEIRAAAARAPEACALSTGGMDFYSNLLPHSPELRRFVVDPRLLDLVVPIGGPDLWVRWDQAVAKGPGAPVFPWHQDNGYNRLRHEHYQVWVALTSATAHNGGLWVVPGSHEGPVPHFRVGSFEEAQVAPSGEICLTAEAGDVTVFSSLLLHTTRPNTTDTERWAYVAEYVRLGHYDPFVWPPYFVAARRGRSAPRYVNWFRGRLNPLEQARYAGPRLKLHREEGRWRRGNA